MLRSLGSQLSAHPGAARVAVAALSLSFVFVATQLGMSQAGPPVEFAPTGSILPTSIGVGIRSTDAVAITFVEPMDTASVEEALDVLPAASTSFRWEDGGRRLWINPARRWATDTRYLVMVGQGATDAHGRSLDQVVRASFTTETAPIVSAFQVAFPSDIAPEREVLAQAETRSDVTAIVDAPAVDAVGQVSTGTTITIGFSQAMNQPDTERHFLISPHVRGSLSWIGNSLIFSPRGRLADDRRYAITVVGAHDIRGNRLGGDASFSFTTRAGAQVVRRSPRGGAKGVDPDRITVWFSGPMNRRATTRALLVRDVSAGAPVRGSISWNRKATQLRFEPKGALPQGHKIRVRLRRSAMDVDRNSVPDTWIFTTKAPPTSYLAPTVRAPVTGPPPPADAAQYALWQINQARARYGLPALRLDSAISAVASAHAWDMINYGYFSHIGRDGSKVEDRLRRAGIRFDWSGENICYYNGLSLKATLNWCHSVFMSEPYPGVANHIGNILGVDYDRLGIGIANQGSKLIIVWDFAG